MTIRTSGCKPGMRGMFAQMGDMVEDAGQQLAQLQQQGADQSRLSRAFPGRA